MKHNYYLPHNDAGKILWFENFFGKLAGYATLLGITAAQMAALENDKKMFTTVVSTLQQIKDFLKSLATFKIEISNGKATGDKNMPLPAAIVPPVAVVEGIFNRVGELVAAIKLNPAYTDTIGNDLGIIGTEINPDFATAKPLPKLSIRNSLAYVKWKKEHTDAADVYADYDDGGGFKFIARITVNHFADPHLPAAGITKIFKYKLRYVVDDHQVGFWSDDEEITVTGI